MGRRNEKFTDRRARTFFHTVAGQTKRGSGRQQAQDTAWTRKFCSISLCERLGHARSATGDSRCTHVLVELLYDGWYDSNPDNFWAVCTNNGRPSTTRRTDLVRLRSLTLTTRRAYGPHSTIHPHRRIPSGEDDTAVARPSVPDPSRAFTSFMFNIVAVDVGRASGFPFQQALAIASMSAGPSWGN